MLHLKKTVIILILTYLAIIDAYRSSRNDESTKINQIGSSKKGRVLWPSLKDKEEIIKNHTEIAMQLRPTDPVDVNIETTEDATDDKDHISSKPIDNRKGRLFWSYPQSPIVEIMMQTVAVNYHPNNHNDPFDFLRDSYPLPKGYTEPIEEYDYIVVGAGSAGSVLASRLSEEKPRSMVLVLEAGKAEMLLTDIPALGPYFQRTDYAWSYAMQHQSGICMGMEEQRCPWPRGRALGGNSVINNMVYSRGRPQDWDRIAQDGNYGWSYNEILKYFMKSERVELKRYKNAQYRGQDGELTVENVPFRTGLAEAFLEAGRINGHPTVDYNAPEGLGFGYVQTMARKGHRLSAAKAFLHPHKRRRNLHIITEARASKIVIEPQTKRAYGVEYFRNGKKYKARCRKEVILSAGPVASPQILMLSGVGPQEHLQSLGIPVIKDLKVGKTLYDHISFPGVIFQLSTTNASILEEKVATLPNLIQWMQYGDGLFSSPAIIEGIGFIKTSQSEDPEQVPDVELISLGGSLASDSGGAVRRGMRMSDHTYYRAFGSLHGRDTWSAVPVLLHPRSKGYLELADSSPFSFPKLYGNYLTDAKDIATFKEAIQYIIKLAESPAFQKYNPKLHLAEYPTCVIHPLGSDEYWECALRTIATTQNHQIGTCKMGPPSDVEAVVDPELRVYGVEGLRVVDSSIIPRTVSGHTDGISIMIGERAADLIKKTWSNVVS